MIKEVNMSGEELKEALAKYLKIKSQDITFIHVASIFGDNKTTVRYI